MREIPLMGGRAALVDDADYAVVAPYEWRLMKKHGGFYARAKQSILMHRLILGLKRGQIADHIDGNGLNNQRGNLRLATAAGNSRNQSQVRGTSRFKGVHRFQGKWWQAAIRAGGGKIYLGLFSDETEAARAYDAAALRLHGEFAKTNAMLGLLSEGE